MGHPRKQGAQGGQFLGAHQGVLAPLQLVQHVVEGRGQGGQFPLRVVRRQACQLAIGQGLYALLHDLQGTRHLTRGEQTGEHQEDGHHRQGQQQGALVRGQGRVHGTAFQTGQMFPQGDDTVAQNAHRIGQGLVVAVLRVGLHGAGIAHQIRMQGGAGTGAGQGVQGSCVALQQFLRPGGETGVLVQIVALVVEKMVLLETAHFQGGVEQLGHLAAFPGLVGNTLELHQRHDRQGNDQAGEGQVDKNDLGLQGAHATSVTAVLQDAACPGCPPQHTLLKNKEIARFMGLARMLLMVTRPQQEFSTCTRPPSRPCLPNVSNLPVDWAGT